MAANTRAYFWWAGQGSPGRDRFGITVASGGEDGIREAERSVGTALPEDLVAWWRRADGQAGHSGLVPSFYTPYTPRGVEPAWFEERRSR